MEMLQGVWKQHLRPLAVVGYGVKIFLPSPPKNVTRSPGGLEGEIFLSACAERPVSRKSRKLFGPEKPFAKLRHANSVELFFS